MRKLQWVVGSLIVALIGCGGDDTGSTEASGTGGQGSTGTTSAASAPTTTGASETATGTGTSGGASNSQGMTTDEPTTAVTGTEPTVTDPTVTGTDPTATSTDATGTTASSTTSGVVPDTTTGTSDGTTGVGESSSGGEDSSTGAPPPCEPGDMGMGGGMVEKSYIWISSHNLHELSKIDTVTMTELARYKTGPAAENPSRTAVSADGRFMVVNNRDTGRSTMVAANVEDCVDKNGNGKIDTSQNKANVLAFGADECVRWSVVLPFAGNHQSGPRGVTWTPGEWDYDLCKYVEPKVWVGYLAAGKVAHFARIDGETGVVEETLLAPNWLGQSGYGPYGAALDPQFRPWFSSLRSEFIRVNTDQNPITLTRITPPANVQSYGMTIDQDGDAWFGGWTGPVTVYEQKNGTYTTIAGTEGGAHRGVAADENYVWAANNNPCGLVQVDRKARKLIAKHQTNPCSTAIGLSIDVEKNVWLVNQGGFAFKFAPDNVLGMQKVDVLGSHYVYSDMTGGQLLSILPQ